MHVPIDTMKKMEGLSLEETICIDLNSLHKRLKIKHYVSFLLVFMNTILTLNILGLVCLFVCVEVLRPSGVMLSAVNLSNHSFTGQALSSKRLTRTVHILSPETDSCPS